MQERTTEVAVVGAGAVGLVAAIAFARNGIATTLVGPRQVRRDGRTAALLQPSLALLRQIGLEQEVLRGSAPLAAMRIVDDTGSLFRPPPATFEARELGLEYFGRNIENATLVDLLWQAADRTPGLNWIDGAAEDVGGEALETVRLASGERLTARLVVAADGRGSRLREAAGIETQSWSYPQSAFTTVFRHQRPHGGRSTEFHTRGGPFTLVPLPSSRSSLVWVTTPADALRLRDLPPKDLAEAAGHNAHRILGRMEADGPSGVVPIGGLTARELVRGRLALVGEAAHALPPIGAQGLNMGLKDVAALFEVTRTARAEGREVGGRSSLAGYERARRRDIEVRTAAVDGLNRALLSNMLGIDAGRGFGLGALARIGPLRRAVMRAGLMSGEATRRGA